ncbi:MAG: response regulator [gamma proteobacterium symbiont of Bathyaustriella thionipta]|nr:response regulator [gamma proteobacterium symbiont of Bathyaustriella thionipta]
MTMNNPEKPAVLLVDDNPANLQILHATLRDGGYRLLIAKDGESALNIIAHVHPALVLLDIMMPAMDGYEVCRRIKADTLMSRTSIIFL